MAAKPKYNAPYHDNWAWSLAAMGATNEEIALAMGVSERTIMRWAKEHESFAVPYKEQEEQPGRTKHFEKCLPILVLQEKNPGD